MFIRITKSLAAAGIILVVVMTGCKKDNNPVEAPNTILLNDAAESIAGAMGDENGGTTDNLADAFMLAQNNGSINGIEPLAEGGIEIVNTPIRNYDSTTGFWTVSIDRSRQGNQVSASFSRVYKYQYLKNGIFQKNYITGSDTATTMKFEIVSGTGYFKNPRVSHRLLSLSGSWIATNINKDTITVNSVTAYKRSAVDSITTRNALRALSHELTLNLTDVKGPRFKNVFLATDPKRALFANAISGTATGTYKATISVQRGSLYNERTVDKSFTITFGNGEGKIGVGGMMFPFDMKGGQCKDK